MTKTRSPEEIAQSKENRKASLKLYRLTHKEKINAINRKSYHNNHERNLKLKIVYNMRYRLKKKDEKINNADTLGFDPTILRSSPIDTTSQATFLMI